LKYILDINKNVLNWSIKKLIDEIENLDRIRLVDLKIKDLIFSQTNQSISSSNGCYIFFDISTNKCVYVGKSSSRPFIERIPAHLDLHPDGWMNSFLKKIVINSSKESDPWMKKSIPVIDNCIYFASGTFFLASFIIVSEISIAVTLKPLLISSFVMGSPGPQPKSRTEAFLGSLLQNRLKVSKYFLFLILG